MRNGILWSVVFAIAGVLLAALGLCIGSVHVPFSEVRGALSGSLPDGTSAIIVRQVRLPQVITAALAGSGLAAAGLIMQTIFRNPLAGPGVLGITSGAGLGVAVATLTGAATFLPLPKDVTLVAAALAGAAGVLLLIVLADRRIGDGLTLLIVGLMTGYLCSAVVSVLQSSSTAQALKDQVMWGMGTFGALRGDRILGLGVPVLLGTGAAVALVKPLNALLLGDAYATSMGTDVARTRRIAIATTGLLAGVVTAFCGPVSFLGLAVPHVARLFVRTSDHTVLMPASITLGATLAIGCDLIVRVAAGLPLNAVTSLLGAPVVLWVLLGGNNRFRS
ncbi:MAG TPA: iron ABC transporter permease [Flavobacteriales bacterium]|nr:iron ABC transporter permease [Flavobacteriales bacterium]HMW96769.1 iron ABC transporter permease [Flavobacteriales bacterium]HNE79334.1 iron ABC transporter permease [Flavobacteriales bacterium]HNI05061.1 iron ABC transporter permease [Flavobacteriales bacterium]HNK85998.1 iron ABC transporter permease [Flavobacteriales bacterium]